MTSYKPHLKNRRQVLSVITTCMLGIVAGCTGNDTEEPDETEEADESEEPDETEEADESEEPDETEEADVTVVLPPDSSELFQNGELQEHDFSESSFTEDQVGTDVSEFNLEIAKTSNVEDMSGMFSGADSFTQDIGGWDTSNVEDMSSMFFSAELFDRDISGWDTSNVEDMSSMFFGAELFTQDISGWDTSNVEDMSEMFMQAESFNQDISSWCVEQIDDKPFGFDFEAEFEDDSAKQPNWGLPCG